MKDEQQNKIEELEGKIYSLERSLKRLSILVEPNLKYPYWHKLLCLGIFEEDKKKLEYIMFHLTARLHQEPNSFRIDTEYPSELFENGLPTLNQTMTIISSTINIEYEEIIQEILLCMYRQGMFKNLISFLFPEEVKKIDEGEL
ncbi:hypothetical protein CSE16_08350 [Solibacillus sp. R5-41]|uniref:hypothetical protein n=1 Tax=Solibacillus sp. R5-41 TaxID=2048654 RepID=UPI000C125DAD|nr:hypothetical protein [Solibacillus sp. R5-41]ATP40058.1 hypothetical protein CSE16_08350 [Solibacillus sp. R5-41]